MAREAYEALFLTSLSYSDKITQKGLTMVAIKVSRRLKGRHCTFELWDSL